METICEGFEITNPEEKVNLSKKERKYLLKKEESGKLVLHEDYEQYLKEIGHTDLIVDYYSLPITTKRIIELKARSTTLARGAEIDKANTIRRILDFETMMGLEPIKKKLNIPTTIGTIAWFKKVANDK